MQQSQEKIALAVFLKIEFTNLSDLQYFSLKEIANAIPDIRMDEPVPCRGTHAEWRELGEGVVNN